jgi:hypothetical protein
MTPDPYYSSLPQRHLPRQGAVFSAPGRTHTLLSQYIHVNVFQCCAWSHALKALALVLRRQDKAMGLKVQIN